MAIPNPLDVLKIPTDLLIALDNRDFHFALQPYHYLIRLVHILTMSAFFGGIALLDLRLIGIRRLMPLKPLAEHTVPWLYASFALAMATGALLFFYDPVHVGAHRYFTPKLIFIVLGALNAVVFHRTTYDLALSANGRLPYSARTAGLISLILWTAVIVSACLNNEAEPKLLLR